MIGKTLGHYAITGKIGAGGMGEVYRGRDGRLDRDVAIKVLPPEVVQDPDRRARFGRHEEAVEEFRTAEALAPEDPPEPSSGLAHVYARMGRREEALAIIEELLELSKRRYVSPYGIASIYACLGDVDRALDWLEKAYDEHDQTLVWLKVHPRLDPVRGTSRYETLARKMNL